MLAEPNVKGKPMPSKKPKSEPVVEDIDVDGEADDSDDLDVVEIVFGGATFVIPRDRGDWPTEAMAWLSEGKFNLFVKYLLDRTKPGQWKVLTTICPRTRDFSAFFVLASKTIRDECTGD